MGTWTIFFKKVCSSFALVALFFGPYVRDYVHQSSSLPKLFFKKSSFINLLRAASNEKTPKWVLFLLAARQGLEPR